jgi:hypothetical protein
MTPATIPRNPISPGHRPRKVVTNNSDTPVECVVGDQFSGK